MNDVIGLKDRVLCGDCLEYMKQMPSDSVDLVVTDPPYGYSFMGKDWDKAVPSTDVWRECVRVLRPGAFAFVMSSPRQDVLIQMVTRLSSAGFETGFTSIYWTYASGFPKALNISKATDSKLGLGREILHHRNKGTHKGGTSCQWSQMQNESGDCPITPPASPEARALDGSYAGFQPKPAVEVILICMKPLNAKTYVAQALENGHGVTWLDDCRIPLAASENADGYVKSFDDSKATSPKFSGVFNGGTVGWYRNSGGDGARHAARFPANLLVSDDVLDDGKITKSKKAPRGGANPNQMDWGGNRPDGSVPKGHTNEGGFSRYFSLDAWWGARIGALPSEVQKVFPFLMVPKASRGEKNEGLVGVSEKAGARPNSPDMTGKFPDHDHRVSGKNSHPTVKPLKLMSYLITLGSRPGGIVLDPFVGSGSTCVAAKLLGRSWIGIDLSEEYCSIARCRIDALHVAATSVKGIQTAL